MAHHSETATEIRIETEIQSPESEAGLAPERLALERLALERLAPERTPYLPIIGIALLLAVMLLGLSPLARNAGRDFTGAGPAQYRPIQNVPGQNAPVQGGPAAIAWEPSYEAAWAAAYAARKPLMLDFYTDWCGWCKKMDSDVYPDAAVVAESQSFVSVKINAEARPDLARQYGVSGFPTVVWIDNRGQTLDLVSGYLPPADFAQWMRAARSKFTPLG